MSKSFCVLNKSADCFFLLILCLYTSLAMADKYNVVLEVNESPPYWSEQMTKDGMCGEIVHAISEQVGLNTNINYKPLQRLINDDSNNDLGDPIFYTAYQDFTAIIPIAVSYVSFFYHNPNHEYIIEINNLSDLANKKVGVLKGTQIDSLALEKAGIIVEESYSQASLFKKLKLGRIDFALEINLIGHQTISKTFPDERDDFISIPIKDSVTPIAIMIAEQQSNGHEISHLYKNGLEKIISEGTYDQILKKYFGDKSVPHDWHHQLTRFQQIYNYGSE